VKLAIVIIVLVAAGAVGVSKAQSPEPADLDILLQIELRNSDGKLISYIEGKKIIQMRPIYLKEYLDGLPDKKIVTIQGKKFELIQFEKQIEYVVKHHAFAIYSLKVPVNVEMTEILLINNDAYQVAPGDTIKPRFTILRPVA